MRSRTFALGLLVAALLAVTWYSARRRSAPERKAGAGTRPAAAAVLLITIDTLRADAVGAYGSAEARTPAMDALAARGSLFERAFASAPITLTSHATLLTGLYPPGHGARHNGVAMRTGVPSLAEKFRGAGARTAAFVSAYPLDRSFGLDRGFDTYSDRMPRGADGRQASERPGRRAVDEATSWLRDHAADRFFAWVHLFEPHAPYGDPSDGRPARVRYDDEIAEADRQVARLLEAVAPRAVETLVIVAGDHGEAFGEHGEKTHSLFVYDTTLRVPLLVAGPGVAPGARVAGPVTLADVAPTISRLAGLPPWDVDGVDLVPFIERERTGRQPIYAESLAPLFDFGWSELRSIRSGRWKYIAAPRPELYDVDADPGETRDVIEANRATASDLEGRLAGGGQSPIVPESGQLVTGPIDPDARRRLQALGYASGRNAPSSGPRRDPKDGRALAAEIALVLSGELRGAALERALESIVSKDPSNPQANLRLGFVRLESRRCADAEVLFARALEGGIPGADAHLGLATCQGRRGAVAEALGSLEAARQREPQNAVVIANIGIAQRELRRYDDAVASLRAALTIDADLHQARFNLALALAQAGDHAAARREAEELLRRLPADAPQRPETDRLLRSLRE